MTAAFATVGGQPATEVVVHVPGRGPWFADVVFEGAPDVSGRVDIVLGERLFSGTIDPRHDGTFGLQRRSRVVAGAGGWGTLVEARAYHSDAGLRARVVADDAARAAGETLSPTEFAPALEQIGIAYVRQAGPASRVLEDVIGEVPWWVGYDGTTRVGSRAETEARSSAYEVLEYRPDQRLATLSLVDEDVAAVGIGSILTSTRLDEDVTIRELELRVEAASVRVLAWCGGSATGDEGRLERALRAIVTRTTDRKLFGVYRYRFRQMSGDRYELQAVSRVAGLPDVVPVSAWPGIGGAHTEPTVAAEVLVQFIGGDRREPIVTHFQGKDASGWTPANLTLDATTLIKIGAGATKPPAWAGELRAELVKIAGALVAAQAPVGGGPLTWAPGTDYPVAGVPAVSALGAAKALVQ